MSLEVPVHARTVPLVGTICVLTLLAAACSGQSTAAPLIPTATTISAGGACAPVIVAPDLFDNYVAVVPSPTPRPPFTGSHFVGLGKVTSLPSDGTSVVLELVEPALFQVFGPTTVKTTTATSFDRSERAWALVSPAGAVAGSIDVPLGANAPAIEAGQSVVMECHRSGGPTLEGGSVASAAPSGAAAWKLSRALTSSWPGGTMVWYERQLHIGSFSDLHLSVGQSVWIEIAGTSGDNRATKLTNAGITFGRKG